MATKTTNKHEFSDNQKILLINEVDAECPLCGKPLLVKKTKNIIKGFEVAHIYPENPTKKEIELLANVDKPKNVNDLSNVLAVCPNCHTEYDTDKELDEYNKWLDIKNKILRKSKIEESYIDYNVEDEIRTVINLLASKNSDNFLKPLSYNSLKIDSKTDETLLHLTKRSIKNNVRDYFLFIKKEFKEIDNLHNGKFTQIAMNVKAFYIKSLEIAETQEEIFNIMVEWLDKKTNNSSKSACEILIAYFIQNCEVFDDVTK